MQSPLADRLRPRTLAEVCGQQHLLGPGRVFRKAIESGRVPNMIFYGPSGVGKTTVARIIAENSGMRLHKLNGTSAGTGDIKAVMAEIGTFQSRNGLLLYLDEIQYLNKKQQQSLLECMEDGTVTLIASTTENPYFYIYTPTSRLKYQIVSAFKYDDRHIMNSFNFQNNGTFEEFIKMIKNPQSTNKNVRSKLDKDITIDDNIVVLSTCVTNQKSNRYLVCGVLVDDEKTY